MSEDQFDVDIKPYSKVAFETDQTIDWNSNTHLLIYGFVRLLMILVPAPIIESIITFYQTKTHARIAYFEYTSRHPPLIRITQLNLDKYSKCNVKALYESYDELNVFHGIESRTAICYVENFPIPKNILSSHSNKLKQNRTYDVIFTIGTNNGGDRTGTAFIIHSDDKTLYSPDVYWWRLPTSQQYMECSTTTYSAKHGLIWIGRHFQVLTFDEQETQNQNEWSWKQIDEDGFLTRTNLSVTMINDKKLFCSGGEGANSRKALKYCNVYDFTSKTWLKLAEMNEGRANGGIYFDNFMEKVYVGGGYVRSYSYTPTKIFECYDINKNKWILLGDTNGQHKMNPIIWSDDVNVINIASCYYSMFETMDMRENKWRIYTDTQSNKVFQKLFKTNTKASRMGGRLCVI